MSEMVERLARRMYEKSEHLDPTPHDGEEVVAWEAIHDRTREFYRLVVRDMLREMREPTEAMYFAALRAMPEIKPGAQHPVVAWRAMIDAALS